MLEIFADTTGEWRFRIRGSNGEIMATSEGYRDRTDARRGFQDLAERVAVLTGTRGAQ